MTELGNRLIEARTAKGLSLHDVQDITKIQTRYLEAIEQGNYNYLPGVFYVRAFIKQYGDAVGLNGDQLLEEFQSELPVVVGDEMGVQLSRVQKARTMAKGNSRIVEFLPIILSILLIVGSGMGIWYYMQTRDNNDTNELPPTGVTTDVETPEDSPLKESEKKEEVKPLEKEEQLVVEQKIEYKTTNGKYATMNVADAEKFMLQLSLTNGKSWVRITGDNKKIFEGIVDGKKEKIKEFNLSSAKVIEVSIGYAPAVQLVINGEKVDYPSSPEQYMTQYITINNLGKK